MFPQPHVLLPVGQVCDPPAGGVRHAQLGELVLQQSRDDCVESRAEIQKQDPGIVSLGVQVQVEDHVDGIVYRSVGSVGKLQGGPGVG